VCALGTCTYTCARKLMAGGHVRENQVPAGFVFHIKAFSLFCAQSVPQNALPRTVREMPEMAALLQPSAAGARLSAAARLSATQMGDAAVQATWDCFNSACMQASQVACPPHNSLPPLLVSHILTKQAHARTHTHTHVCLYLTHKSV